MDDHQFKEEENGSVGELSTVCSQIVLTCLYLSRIGRLDIFWFVNKLARAVAKWTKACDKRLARLISYKMIIKGRSPTMIHGSRTDRVALDWLFDRINFDSKLQIRYIDTKHQLADILTKGYFTPDEWNNLLHVFNIRHFSSTCCAQNSSLISCLKRWLRGCRNRKKKK